MTIDGFLGFLGLVVAIYALLSVVSRYRVRLHGVFLWLPTLVALATVIYLLLFDLLAPTCDANWCKRFGLSADAAVTPNTLAFIVVLGWLAYISLLSLRKRVGKRQLPLLASLVDRLVSEKRLPELVDFIEPQVVLISLCAGRQLWWQRLRDRVNWHGSIFAPRNPPSPTEPTTIEKAKIRLGSFCLASLKPVLTRLPEDRRSEEAAQRILRVLHTNERVVEFLALERPIFAMRLMDTRTYDYDFSDRVFDRMMAHPESELRRETVLNGNLERCFYKIDPKNPLIHALFADANVADNLAVWRPVGNYPLRLLERNIDDYREAISASKPWEDEIVHRDPTYVMILFFDIMVRSAMRDGLSSHMWLMYYDILVDKLLRFMDRSHPDYDVNAEFPNFGYYLIYEVFHVYGEWLGAIECCPEDSPAITLSNTEPHTMESGAVKPTMASMARSLRYLISSETEDRFVAYVIEMIMRDYKNLSGVPNGSRYQEALRKHLIAGDEYRPNAEYGARLRDCYDQIDHCMRSDTPDFGAALKSAYPRWGEQPSKGSE